MKNHWITIYSETGFPLFSAPLTEDVVGIFTGMAAQITDEEIKLTNPKEVLALVTQIIHKYPIYLHYKGQAAVLPEGKAYKIVVTQKHESTTPIGEYL